MRSGNVGSEGLQRSAKWLQPLGERLITSRGVTHCGPATRCLSQPQSLQRGPHSLAQRPVALHTASK